MSKVKKILIIGGGFAGVWAALSAKRYCHLLNKENEFEITLINKDEYHGLRPRYYEQDLSETRIPLTNILKPFGMKHIIGEVTVINTAQRKVDIKNTSSELEIHDYDRLILAAGSHLHSPSVPGLNTYAFDVDTYKSAKHLAKHIHALPQKFPKGQYTAVIVGGGFTGIEIATDVVDRLRNIASDPSDVRVIIVDHNEIGSTLGSEPQQVVLKALRDLKIETKTFTHISSIEHDQITLDSGEVIDTQTVIWTAGMRASPLTKIFPVELDRYGRLPVDAFLRVQGISDVFAAGDVAAAMPDETHHAMLSCQHAMPQGRYAGHNAVADLAGESLLPYEQRKWVCSIDLGSCGALYAEGWDLKMLEEGAKAKEIKLYINHKRISPPTDGDMEKLIDIAEPVFKSMPFSY